MSQPLHIECQNAFEEVGHPVCSDKEQRNRNEHYAFETSNINISHCRKVVHKDG